MANRARQGYKVVRVVDGRRESAMAEIAFHRRYAAVYEPGSWTAPPVDQGPLTVFATEEHAEAFWRHFRPNPFVQYELWACEWIPSRFHTLWTVPDHRVRAQRFRPGTRLASYIRLLAPMAWRYWQDTGGSA